MATHWWPTSKALFSGLFSTPELRAERMTSYYTGTGDVTRSKLASTWESKPPEKFGLENPEVNPKLMTQLISTNPDAGMSSISAAAEYP